MYSESVCQLITLQCPHQFYFVAPVVGLTSPLISCKVTEWCPVTTGFPWQISDTIQTKVKVCCCCCFSSTQNYTFVSKNWTYYFSSRLVNIFPAKAWLLLTCMFSKTQKSQGKTREQQKTIFSGSAYFWTFLY